MDDALEQARRWVDADAPVLWLLGKTQSGKTSILAEITGQGHDEVGRGYRPMTRESRLHAFPPERPVLRVLDTRGLADRADEDVSGDLDRAREQAHLLLAVVRVEDLEIGEILDLVRQARRQHPRLPLIVAQTCLHHLHGPDDRHPEPYPFDGTDDDRHRIGVPVELGRCILAQRRLFSGIKGEPPLFVPLDFTRPEQRVLPPDYGAERLWDLLERALPEVAERLRLNRVCEEAIRTRVILPYAMAAAAANAVPVPLLGGLGAAGLQSAMVVRIARRLGCAGDFMALWRELVGALGTGFLASFGGSWMAQQVLKLGLGWGTALVASWSFAISWAIGETALYYFGEKSAGQAPEREALRARYRAALKSARDTYKPPEAGPP